MAATLAAAATKAEALNPLCRWALPDRTHPHTAPRPGTADTEAAAAITRELPLPSTALPLTVEYKQELDPATTFIPE